jgi:pimeloyl-ACP methyl ester carboxylesterase
VKRKRTGRVIVDIAALVIILLCWWQVQRAEEGLARRTMRHEDVPLTFLVAKDATTVPGVIIAHGFAGSRQLMLGYGHVLAHAGYGVMLLDFDGHGQNGRPLVQGSNALQANIEAAYDALAAQPVIEQERIALLGHSMGSGAVMQAAIAQPDRYQATIAISPTGANVTAERPRNLLLQAGVFEPQFLANAQDLLARAGGANDDFAGGRARRLVTVPTAEHITILFHPASHQAALAWLDELFGRETTMIHRDRRLIYYLLHLLSWLLLALVLAPFLPIPTSRNGRPARHWLGVLSGPLIAAAVVGLLSRWLALSSFGGMLVSGALAIWFLVFGLCWLLTAFPIPRPALVDLLWGAALFAFLSLAFGAMAHSTWLPWWMLAPRLHRWPFLAAAVLPWLLAAGLAQQASGWRGRAAWWLVQSVTIVVGLLLMVLLAPGLFFVFLLLPLMPIVLALLGIGAGVVRRPWSGAIGNSLFFGWLLAAAFPLT